MIIHTYLLKQKKVFALSLCFGNEHFPLHQIDLVINGLVKFLFLSISKQVCQVDASKCVHPYCT